MTENIIANRNSSNSIVKHFAGWIRLCKTDYIWANCPC